MPVLAGFGSRQTPAHELAMMIEVARRMALRGWTLRTGGAIGADTAFLTGCLQAGGLFELYLAFAGQTAMAPATLEEPTAQAMAIAAKYHPRWASLDRVTKKLMGRNVHIGLGEDCRTPPAVAVCWTPDGTLDGRFASHGPGSGGTGHTLRVLVGETPAMPPVEILNLARPQDWNRMVDWLQDPRFARREVHLQESLL